MRGAARLGQQSRGSAGARSRSPHPEPPRSGESKDRAPVPRILVIKLGALGDFVQALGPAAAIRAHHPEAAITLLTTAPFAELARAAPGSPGSTISRPATARASTTGSWVPGGGRNGAASHAAPRTRTTTPRA